jgi:hypothetical protein
MSTENNIEAVSFVLNIPGFVSHFSFKNIFNFLGYFTLFLNLYSQEQRLLW